MQYTAKHRFADVSAQKMRPFAQLIRGKNVDDALEQLRFFPNRGARLIEAVVKSAIGNAEDQGCQNLDDLIVSVARIDGGPMYKRIRPRARGTAFQILRRLSHIVISVSLPPDEGDTDETTAAPQAVEAAVPALVTSAPAPQPTESPEPAASEPASGDAQPK